MPYKSYKSTKLNKLFLLLISCLLVAVGWSNSFSASVTRKDTTGTIVQFENKKTMKLKITINNEVITATLNNSETAKDFASLLPMMLTLDDYGQTEKISSLSKRLTTDGAPDGCDPDVGDITYFAPWGNLAIFYKDFGYADGLIKLGEITGDLSPLKTDGNIEAIFEVVE